MDGELEVIWVIGGSSDPWALDQKRALASLWYNIKGGFQAFKKSKCYEAVCKKDYATIFKEWDWGASQMKGLSCIFIYEIW